MAAVTPPEDLQTPTLAQVLQRAMEDRLEDLHTCSWGYVTSYDAASQSCTVQLVLRRQFVVEGGEVQSERPAPLVSVPVVFPGAGDYSITWPLKSGDVVLVVFAERAMHQWNAGGQEDLEPDDGRMHSLSDAVAIPGLRPRSKPLPTPPSDAMVLTVPDGETVKIGGLDAQSLATKADLQAVVNYLKLQFDNVAGHVHTVSGSVTTGIVESGGPPVTPGTCPSPAGTTKALGT